METSDDSYLTSIRVLGPEPPRLDLRFTAALLQARSGCRGCQRVPAARCQAGQRHGRLRVLHRAVGLRDLRARSRAPDERLDEPRELRCDFVGATTTIRW